MRLTTTGCGLRVGVVLCLLATSDSAAVETEQRIATQTSWWHDSDVQQALQLTTAQIAALDRAFTKDMSERVALRRKVERLDRDLQHLLGDATVDNETIVWMVTKVEELRARHKVARTMMLVALYRILTPQQQMIMTKSGARRDLLRGVEPLAR